ncbi:MAG TPA: LysM peptidoglycan-binding domain-containing protein [Thiobacillus sp.]
MDAQAPAKTGFERWQDRLSNAVGDVKWNAYDCEIQMAVNKFNQHLAGTPNYMPLDWQLIKAMVWTETGAMQAEWGIKPMQIGVAGDPGLASFLSGTEGGDLILPPAWKGRLTTGSVRVIPSHNIRAGIGYLLMRMANTEYKTLPAADSKIYEITIKPGDSMDKIARTHGSTTEHLKKLNPTANILRPGQTIKFQKASTQRSITSWRYISTSMIAQRYNGGGDPNYARKLDYALSLIRQGKTTACAQ